MGRAKELIKADMIGKSDPYAVLSYGKQTEKTKVVKNSQEPQWNHEVEFDVTEGKWFPLSGVKSGKVLLSADFLDDLGRKASDILPSLLNSGDPNDPHGLTNDPSNKPGYPDTAGGADVKLPSGKAKINLIKAKELIKADMIGKSDPYAILSYGKQKEKTNVVKNTQEPQWN